MASAKLHKVLIVSKAYAGNGGELLSKSVSGLGSVIKVEKLSSVYRIKIEEEESKTIHDLRSRKSYAGLVVVIKAGNTVSPN